MKIWVPPKEVAVFRGSISDLRVTYGAARYEAKDQITRVLLPVQVVQYMELRFNDNLLRADYLARALTIEYE